MSVQNTDANIYWISSRGQPTRGGPPACGWSRGYELLTAKN